ncbi:hypothetical protein BDR03DRAFT_1018661 [Suillus americanus]|nr:hypothetical protein BDR03DRAFT_1018661 [Suillus americanus]
MTLYLPPLYLPLQSLPFLLLPLSSVLFKKWVDAGDRALDPEDLDLLLDIMDIPNKVSSMLLPSSDAVNVQQVLKFMLPDLMGPSHRPEHHALTAHV